LAFHHSHAGDPSSDDQAKLRLKAEDILVAENAETKFGTIDETPLEGLIKAHDADVYELAAVSQTTAHELIGQMSNLSAEALAAAEVSLTRRVTRLKSPVAEAHKQTFRLAGKIMGNDDVARDLSSEIIWKDTESKSFNAAADGLAKIAKALGVPVEMLWEDIPGWTQEKVDRAKKLVQEGDSLDRLIKAVTDGATSPEPDPVLG
jgi:hypothetical protein